MSKYIGIRQRFDGRYEIAEFSVVRSNYAGIRKYSDSYDLAYKKADFAENKCKAFFARVFSYCQDELKYIGLVNPDEYKGESGSESELKAYNS